MASLYMLLLKIERPGATLLSFAGMLPSLEAAGRHVHGPYGKLTEDTGFGNRRMLEAQGVPVKRIFVSGTVTDDYPETYLVAEYEA